MTSRTFTTHDGLRLRVLVQGTADAETTVVLSHCWTSDLRSWGYQALDLRAAFGDRVRILRYDHRGHGDSEESPEAAATIDNLGTDLAGVIDAFAPTGRLVLAGHSIGGMTLMALAEQRPEIYSRVAGVVLVSTSSGDLSEVTLGLPVKPGDRARRQIPRVLAARSRMLSRRQRRRAPVVETLVARRLLFGKGSRADDRALAVEGIISSPAATMCGFFTDLMRHDRFEGLGALTGVPVHILVGACDRLTPPPHAQRLASALPDAKLSVIPGAGHMLPLERDRTVSNALIEMLEAATAGVPAAVGG